MTVEIKIPWEVAAWIEDLEKKLLSRIEALEKDNKFLKEELDKIPSIIRWKIQENNDPYND